jgi:hypothetical protein
MRETAWLKGDKLRLMLEYLRANGSRRKLRLFACACCRALDALMARPASRRAVETAERFADGRASREKLSAAQKAATIEVDAARARHETKPFVLASSASACAYASDWSAANWCSLSVRNGGLRYPEQVALLRDIFGNPFRPVSFTPPGRRADAVRIARAIYQSRAFQEMPILADALEDAGCDSADMLAHCRGPGPHVRGCWVVDLVLEKE